ncbi:CRISPR-associated protein Cas1 [Pyrodictium delaneyi]|uniref:CRISPR-associated endonuclease Cas1 n=1 Tax=Pyrodictium delaneyi TaxID=1273541 RepID=A0A0P0N2R3_9CREN|nr:CRISPR-associated endonuclease Cas1 [Pyrodictium delaneyi]ALL00365.1 CRISPR-associated protein Cas1 [Pyrodictium delaneyi]OWJ54420.1 CRISPR-associated endonuclease Cas1 [Pyrodictium delaneyi]
MSILENVLIVSTPGSRIYVRHGVVYIQAPDSKPIPVTFDTELLVLATGGVSISGRALRRLSELGVRLVVLGQRGQVAGELRPVDRVNRTIESRLAQYRVKLEGRGLAYAAEMVYAKIVNQARLLRYLAKSRREPWLRDDGYAVEEYAARLRSTLDEGRRLDENLVRGLEAQAARRYWSALAALIPWDTGFRGRDPRGEDPVNKALSYSYAILYSVASDALTVAGLDPYAGFLHRDRSGKPSLVYDYSDTFKPIAVDKALFTNIDQQLFELYQGSLTYTARRELARRVLENLASPYTDAAGKRRRLRDHIYGYAWSLAQSLRENRRYQAFRARL